MSHALHNRPGIRFHAAKYNVDTAARKRLKVALRTLVEHAEALRMALGVDGCTSVEPGYVLDRARGALETLVYGEKGEFR